MFRYARLFNRQFRTSVLVAAQYRWDFLIDGVISVFWACTAIVPLFVVYRGQQHASIPGWSLEESLVVIGWFILLQGVLEGVINPGLAAVVDHIRKGTLDFILLKPADAQFLVSTSRFALWLVASLFTAGGVFIIAFTRLGRWPDASGIGVSFVLLIAATAALYSLWVLIISSAFFVVKVDNLTYLFSSIFDAARWPVTVFKGAWRIVFTFVIPLALMTTYPAQALLGRLEANTVLYSLLGTAALAVVSRTVWMLSLRRYSSASS